METTKKTINKILISKKNYKHYLKYQDEFDYDLFDGFCMEIRRIKAIKNCFGFIKYYKFYVKCIDTTQKQIVESFQFIGLIQYKGN